MKNAIHWKKGLLLLLIPITFIGASAWVSPEKACEEAMVTKLIDICGQNQVVGGNPPPVECDQGAIVVDINDACYSYVPLTIYMTNIHPNPANQTDDYIFPTGKNPIYVVHESSPGVFLTSGPHTSAKYKGDIPVGLENVPIFGIDLDLYTIETNDIGCAAERISARNFPMNVSLYTWKEGTMTLYPVEEETDAQSGLFSCDIFSETHCDCLPPEPNKPCEIMPPSYDLTVCIDCNCTDDIKPRLTNSGEATKDKSFIDNVIVSPNPSTDNFNLSFDIQESTEVNFRIVDNQGKEIQSTTMEVEAGEQVRNFNVSQLSTGVYFLQIITEQEKITKKLAVIK